MDDNDQIHEGFSQDECIEWVENRNVDLRQLARSPHMPATPALLGTQTASSAKPPRRSNSEQDETPPAHLVKNLDKNYSPKQEIAHLMEPAAQEEAHEAPTQPQANVAKTSDTLGMRHGRRRRDASSVTNKQPKKLKRTNTDPTALKGRRRPRSSGSTTSASGGQQQQQQQQVATNSFSDGVDFEDLLKELDQPRIPLHPTKVNMPGKGESKKTAPTSKPPAKMNAPPTFSGTSAAAPVAAALPTTANRPSSSYPTNPNIPQNGAVISNYNNAPKPTPTIVLPSAPKQVYNPYPPPKTAVPAPPVKPQPASVTLNSNVQNRQGSHSSGSLSAAHENKTPATKLSKAPSTSPFILDDLQLSEEDWAQMDALMTQAESRRNSDPPAKEDDSYSTKDWKAIQAIDESLARSVGHSSVAEASKQPTNDSANKDDEFDDFPIFDFEAMDRVIAERSTAASDTPADGNTVPSADTPVRNPVSPTFDPQHSFIAFSRYKVVGTEVEKNTYTKTVFLKEWRTAMLKDERKNSLHHSSSLERSNSLPTTSEMDMNSSDGRIFLRGEWYHTHVEAGDIVHLCSLSGKYRTDVGALPVLLDTSPPQGSDTDDDLVLVVHPDRLIPPTTISETVTCSRRAVLRMRLGSTGISCKLNVCVHLVVRHSLSHSNYLNLPFLFCSQGSSIRYNAT